MDPRLVAISGPSKGSIFKLTEDEASIGRLSSNRICISDMALSRSHCLVRREAGRFMLRDLESRNGSFVNEVPVKERWLEHGDQIAIGDSLLIFLTQEEERTPPSSVQLEQTELLTGATVRLRLEDALYLSGGHAAAEARRSNRKARDLDALLRISTAVNSIRSLDTLQPRLLELILEVIPAERGVILLLGNRSDEFASTCGWTRSPQAERPVQVSRTILRQVLQERVGILSNDVLGGDEFNAAQSLVTSRVTALIAAPLLVFDRMIGVLYLDARTPAVRFDEDHLQLLTGIAGIAASALENARHMERLELENQRLQGEIKLEHSMVGESQPMREVLQFVAKVAPRESTVLICGESGTGKELVARALHLNSPRAGRPFVAINCAAIAETLLESEMFGHEKGAFTGALGQKKGRLEVADGGTVFLDEVSELAPTLQAKLLRVLQEREFERVGGTHPLRVNIRVIAATNKTLEEEIRSGRFRTDLYYRLNVVSLTLPPLRERRDDILLLATHFIRKYSERCNRQSVSMTAETRTCLMNYDWPGNVRELENAIERAVVLGSGDLIRPEDLPEQVVEAASPKAGTLPRYHQAVRDAKRELILQAVEQTAGNFTEAAKWLGVHPNYLHRLVRNLNLKAEVAKNRS